MESAQSDHQPKARAHDDEDGGEGEQGVEIPRRPLLLAREEAEDVDALEPLHGRLCATGAEACQARREAAIFTPRGPPSSQAVPPGDPRTRAGCRRVCAARWRCLRRMFPRPRWAPDRARIGHGSGRREGERCHGRRGTSRGGDATRRWTGRHRQRRAGTCGGCKRYDGGGKRFVRGRCGPGRFGGSVNALLPCALSHLCGAAGVVSKRTQVFFGSHVPMTIGPQSPRR
mmetsp:Transcript_30845/g.98512  ORF Transcript_30845/g.98512 Transcript_30845/m.98512 type:complete len:229 (+) Transcript_30845:478-1164(+)